MYEVSIRKTETIKKVAGKDWVIVEYGDDGKGKFGYTPEIEKHVESVIEIYRQTVDELDIIAVIAAVNGFSVKS